MDFNSGFGEVEFQKAKQLYLNGAWQESLSILLPLIEDFPNELKLYIFVGANLEELGKTEEAIPFHESAIRLAPTDRIASLGLFHALWDLRRDEEALLEAVRFDGANGKTEYVEILTDHVRGNFRGVTISQEMALLVEQHVARYPRAYRPPNPDRIDVDGQSGT